MKCPYDQERWVFEWEERAGIMEYHGGMTRDEAERAAKVIVDALIAAEGDGV